MGSSDDGCSKKQHQEGAKIQRSLYKLYTNLGFGSKKVLFLSDLPLKSCIVWVGVIY